MFKPIKETVTDVKQLVRSCQKLATNAKHLQESLPAVNKFQREIQKDIAKWQFKDQLHLEKIRKITERLSKQSKA